MSDSMQRFTYASGSNATFIDSMYTQFRADPESVDDTWRKFFEGYEFAIQSGIPAPGGVIGSDEALTNAKVEAFINAHRRIGHLSAHLDPLNPKPAVNSDMLPEAHGLSGVDPKQVFHPVNLPEAGGKSFGEIYDLLLKTYCGRIGAEIRDIEDIEIIKWIQLKMESCRNQPEMSSSQKKRIHSKLNESEGFEKFLHARFLGQKRFSLEGAEAFVPFMDTIINEGSRGGVEEVNIGMAHRGRLNTLVNVLGKPAELIFKEFEGSEFNLFDIDGDVKYHMGYASEIETDDGGRVRLYLSPNPSHLEAVNPVVEGFARARQRLIGDNEKRRVMPVLVHGDASFMGQGIVAETLNLSNLESYKTGGTIHIIINNQVGFTTSPRDSRSCTYSSGMAKILRAPVLHVNADDPEAVVWCAMIAANFRQKFGSDIVIDLIGYRRHGHNETDEPGFTQPVMYKKIAAHQSVLTQYSDRLISENVMTREEVEREAEKFKDGLQVLLDSVRGKKDEKSTAAGGKPAVVVPVALQKALSYRKVALEEIEAPVETGVGTDLLRAMTAKMCTVPTTFKPHQKAARLLDLRLKMVEGKGAVDWAMGELLAFASLASEGHHVRLSGQDCQRGTFSSRHSVLNDFETGEPLHLLNQIAVGQAPVDIINSPLSEAGVMGFDFGYTIADPDALVLWEAQFGDFVNGAQIIIDQFLVASEAKWKQVSGLVLLLPHGYEGQGPEHSSARPERFLQLCGNLNIQVAIPTTPAQHFHLLRRQIHRSFRKPLIVMSPKSLLRHPKAISSMDQLSKGRFSEVLDDTIKGKEKASRLVMCAGKLFYELDEVREANKPAQGTPIIRIEQLYPFPEKVLKNILAEYPSIKEVVWTQEEPQNMGAWTFVRPLLRDLLPEKVSLKYVGRKSSGTTAEGASKAHQAEQARIIAEALGLTSAIKKDASAASK